jgi:hypothetical protein
MSFLSVAKISQFVQDDKAYRLAADRSATFCRPIQMFDFVLRPEGLRISAQIANSSVISDLKTSDIAPNAGKHGTINTPVRVRNLISFDTRIHESLAYVPMITTD